MTVTITDCGDEWTYDYFTVIRDHELGLSVEVEGELEDVPWVYAFKVDVDIDHEGYRRSFRGWPTFPTDMTFTPGEPVVLEATITESAWP